MQDIRVGIPFSARTCYQEARQPSAAELLLVFYVLTASLSLPPQPFQLFSSQAKWDLFVIQLDSVPLGCFELLQLLLLGLA